MSAFALRSPMCSSLSLLYTSFILWNFSSFAFAFFSSSSAFLVASQPVVAVVCRTSFSCPRSRMVRSCSASWESMTASWRRRSSMARWSSTRTRCSSIRSSQFSRIS
uniref:Putative secreted protein n=1 Tax=Ixodes ricinus TaxID=34613 RepID=A0A6B0UI32_IXORI